MKFQFEYDVVTRRVSETLRQSEKDAEQMKFNKQVAQCLEQGWQLAGGISVQHTPLTNEMVFHQAIYRRVA